MAEKGDETEAELTITEGKDAEAVAAAAVVAVVVVEEGKKEEG